MNDSRPSTNQLPVDAELPIAHVSLTDFSGDVLGHLLSLHERFGPVAAIEDGSQRVVFLFDPELNYQVLRDTQTYEVRFFGIRGPKRSSQRRLTCGLLGMNGPQHSRNRRIVKEPFALRSIASYLPTIESLTDEMLASWQVGQTVDLAEEMTRYMLSVTSTLLFGMHDLDEACRLGDQIADWVSKMHNIGAGVLVPCDAFSEGYEDLLSTAERLESSVAAMIDRRRQEGFTGHDVLSLLVRGHLEGGQLDEEELIGQACVLFGAAHMTTAHSLTWTLLLLALHPRVAHQFWQELQAGDASESPLLERVIKESMRVLPASAYSQRLTARRVEVGPFDCPPGTPIVFTPLITHRLESIYQRPKQYDPDRWLTISPSPYAYLPFGAGSRMCIGAPLAMKILRTTIPRILSRYRLHVPAGTELNAMVHGTMLWPVGACPVELGEADGCFESAEVAGNIAELLDLPAPERVTTAPRKPR